MLGKILWMIIAAATAPATYLKDWFLNAAREFSHKTETRLGNAWSLPQLDGGQTFVNSHHQAPLVQIFWRTQTAVRYRMMGQNQAQGRKSFARQLANSFWECFIKSQFACNPHHTFTLGSRPWHTLWLTRVTHTHTQPETLKSHIYVKAHVPGIHGG